MGNSKCMGGSSTHSTNPDVTDTGSNTDKKNNSSTETTAQIFHARHIIC